MANSSAIRQQAAHTTYHLPTDQREPCKKASLHQNCLGIFWGRIRIMDHSHTKKGQDRKCKSIRQKNETGDRKGESNDNPEIPDWDRTSDIPRGGFLEKCEQSHVLPKITTPHSKHKMYFSLSLKITTLHRKHKMYFSLSLKIKTLHSKPKMYFSLSLKIKTLHSKHKMFFSLSLKFSITSLF